MFQLDATQAIGRKKRTSVRRSELDSGISGFAGIIDPDKVLHAGLERWQGSVLFIGGAVDHDVQTVAACVIAIGSKAPECFGVMRAKGIQHSEVFLRNNQGERRPYDSHAPQMPNFVFAGNNGH